MQREVKYAQPREHGTTRLQPSSVHLFSAGNGYVCSGCHSYPCGGIYYSICPMCKRLSNNSHVDRRDYLCYNCADGLGNCNCNQENIPTPRPVILTPPKSSQHSISSDTAKSPPKTHSPVNMCCCYHSSYLTCNYMYDCNCCRIFCKCQSNSCRDCWNFDCCKCWTCRCCDCKNCSCCRCYNCCKRVIHFSDQID